MTGIPPTKRAGLTLIEVLVAMALVAMMGSLVYGGFAQTASNKRKVEHQLDRYHEIGAAMERMVTEISMAYVSVHLPPNEGLQQQLTAFIGDTARGGSRLDFNSLSHTRIYRNARETDQNELSYFLADAPDGDGQVLARRIQPRIDNRPGEGGRVEVLLEGVEDFELKYYDEQTNDWVDRWDSQTTQQNRLPAQVKILVTVVDPLDDTRDRTFGTRASLGMRWAMNHAVYK